MKQSNTIHRRLLPPSPAARGRGDGLPRRAGLPLFLLLLLLLSLTSCSTTANLPEGDVLYTGIGEITYGAKSGKTGQAAARDSTGVITSLARAYETVGDLFSGHLDAAAIRRQVKDDETLTRRQRDSLNHEADLLDEATATMKEEVNAALAYAPNNSFLGSSSVRWPLPLGLWAYNGFVHSRGGFGKWFFNTFASTPRTLAMANPRLRTQVARQAMRGHGFFRAQATYEILPDAKDPRKAKVAYNVLPGPLFRLGTIEYQRFSPPTDSLLQRSMAATELHTGDAFSAHRLDAERKRLSQLFRNEGFYYFRPEYITYRADTLQQARTVQLQVRPRPDMPRQARNRFFMGRTTITVMPYDDFRVTDSITFRDASTMRWSGGTPKPPIRYGAIRHNLFYQRGSLYRQRLHERIQEKLSGMGVFSSIQMNYTPRDTSATCDTLDINILAILDKPWDSEFEAKVTNKSNGLLGPGLSYGMTRRNAFRGAESASFKVYGSYEWQTGANTSHAGRSLMNAFELGAQLTLAYPRVKFFGLTRAINRRAMGTTTYKAEADWMNRAGFFQMVSFGARLTYTYQRRRHVRHELTPFRLDYQLLAHRSSRFDSIMHDNPALYVSMRDQLVPSMAYTLTYARTAAGGRARTLILHAKEAGHVTNGAYALAGRARKERGKRLLGTPFAQFLKLTAEWRETFPLTQRSAIAARIFAGAVWSYGNSTMAPYQDLLSIGGANSIRAFGIRTIGPGRYHPANAAWSYVNQVGDLKLEANVEYRFPLVASLCGALFLDAGNVWLMQPDDARPGGAVDLSRLGTDIALGTGLGLRYDLEFLVLRLDVGVGLHAPYDTGRKGYYNIPRFSDSLGFHIAVGYPF